MEEMTLKTSPELMNPLLSLFVLDERKIGRLEIEICLERG